MARVYRATIRASYTDGTLVQPSLHYQTDVSTGGSEPDPNDVASGIWGLVGASFLAATHSLIKIHELVATEQVIPPAIGVVGVHTVELNGSFTTGAEQLPREFVPLINLHTGTSSRSARGHLFLAGPSTPSAVGVRIWTTTSLGVFQTFADTLNDSFDLGTVSITHVNPVVYSRTRHGRGNDPFAFRVTSASAKPQPTWLRSRGSAP